MYNAIHLPIKNKKAVKKERKKEPAGTHVDCGGRLYTLEALLGSGRFGDVYKVSYQGQFFAMKTERFVEVPEARRRLKVEYNVYTAVQSAAQKHAANRYIFAKMQEFGKTKTFAFMIMEIVGPSLYDIRKKMLNGENPSPRTVAEIARQTLWSIEALHDVGWTHRDIKPSNYAIGLPPRDSSIVMLDFGTARMYREKDGRVRAPRTNPAWKGTPRYATARGLKGQEQSRRDDMEIWCFMMLEFYELRNMAWSYGSYSLKMIIAMKEKVMNDAAALRKEKLIECPARFCAIVAYVSALTYSEAVDFNKIHGILEEIIKDEKIDMSLPLDWIGKEIVVDKDKGKLPGQEKHTGPMEVTLGNAGSERDSSSKGSSGPRLDSGLLDRRRKEENPRKLRDPKKAALSEKIRRLEDEILKISSELGEDEDKGRKKGRKKRREEEEESSGSSEDSEHERDTDSSYRRHRRRRRKRRTRKRSRGHRTREESEADGRSRREDSDRDRRRADRPRDSPDREKNRDEEDDNVKRRRTSEDKKRAGVKNKDASEEKEKRKEKDAKKGSIEDQKPEAAKDKNNEKATDEKGKDKGKKNDCKEMLSPGKASPATQETPSKDSDNKKK